MLGLGIGAALVKLLAAAGAVLVGLFAVYRFGRKAAEADHDIKAVTAQATAAEARATAAGEVATLDEPGLDAELREQRAAIERKRAAAGRQ